MTSSILKKCLKEAEKSSFAQFRIGAVIFKGNRILASGRNEIRSCSKLPNKYQKYRNSLHAEQSAILSIHDYSNLKGASILTIRLSRDDKIRLAKPCEMCQKFIKHVGIKQVWFSENDGSITRQKIDEMR